MKHYIHIILINLYFTILLPAQTDYEEKWIKYYEPIENKIIGVWPHNDRYSDLSKLKEFRYRWGFNHVLFARNRGMEYYNMLIAAGFDSTKIMRQIKQDTYFLNKGRVKLFFAKYPYKA